MNALAEAVFRKSWIAQGSEKIPAQPASPSAAPPTIASDLDEHIQLLAQQIFFRSDGPKLRHVGFAATEAETDVAWLCLGLARALAKGGKQTLALMDAVPKSAALPLRMGHRSDLQEPAFDAKEQNRCFWGSRKRELEPGLWIVPRQEWLQDNHAASAESLAGLRELIAAFDISILCCGPMSSLAAKIAQFCDGLVLVLTAGRTRRLVAERMKEQLRNLNVRLLGTVLTERRFPVPTALYRKL